MKRWVCLGNALLFVVVVSVADLAAEVVPGRWEKVEELSDGDPIVVTMKSGDRLRYRYNGSSETEVSVVDSYHKHWTLPKSEISLITRPPKKDSNVNGTLVGFAVGALGGVALGAAGSSGDSQLGYLVPGLGIIGGGIGALTGAIADASTGETVAEVLYRAR